jgi:uncharacterized lipoprotein YmbA
LKRHLKVSLAAVCVVAAGCSPLAPRPDYSRFFVLTPIADTSSAPGSAGAPTIGIGPIDFPDYLKRLEVVSRRAPNRLDISPVDRWGEPLDKNFQRVLAENLAQLVHTDKLEMYPWPRRTPVDYQIEMVVQNFETMPSGQSQLSARWTIKNGATGHELYAGRTVASATPPAGETGVAAALSDDLATLSREIATQIDDLNQNRHASLPPS